MRDFIGLLACMALYIGGAQASFALENGVHSVFLQDTEGARIHVADLQIENDAYRIEMKAEPFADHFLSMRPFKCLEGPEKTWCHVPYPYDIARNIGNGLTDIEYDLLFLWKGTGDYGINTWNGVYYLLEEDVDGVVRGRLHEMDMDILSVPPEKENMRPIRDVDLEEGEPDSHWLPVLVIE